MFSEYHWPVYAADVRTHREPEVGLRAGHHELEVVGRLAVGLRPGPRHAGDAAVLDAAAAAFFDLHLQLQIEVAGLFAAIDDVVVALWLALQRLADHDAVFDAPDGGVGVPAGETVAVEDLLVAGVLVDVVGRGVVELGHTRELLAMRARLGRTRRGRLESRRHGLSEDRAGPGRTVTLSAARMSGQRERGQGRDDLDMGSSRLLSRQSICLCSFVSGVVGRHQKSRRGWAVFRWAIQ